MRRLVPFVMPYVLLTFILSTFPGCALVNGTTQRVAITSNVPDVKIVVDGRPRGRTEEGAPLVVVLKRSSEHIVTALKDGYTSNYVRIDSQLCTLGILDIVGTWLFLLPGISLLTGGAFELTPSEVYIALDPKQPSVQVAPPVQAPVATPAAPAVAPVPAPVAPPAAE